MFNFFVGPYQTHLHKYNRVKSERPFAKRRAYLKERLVAKYLSFPEVLIWVGMAIENWAVIRLYAACQIVEIKRQITYDTIKKLYQNL